MLFGNRYNDIYANVIENRQAIADLLVAAARMGLPVLELSNDDWQRLNAEVLIDECKRTLKRNTIRQNQEDVSNMQYFGLDIDFMGLRPCSKRLKFQWAAVYVQMDVEVLYNYVTSVISSGSRAGISRLFNRRIADPRYIFATNAKCQVPQKLEDYQNMNDETFSLMFDWLMFYLVDRWTVNSSRLQDFSPYRGDSAKEHRSRGSRLKSWLIELPFSEGAEFEQFYALAKEATREITKRVTPVLYNMGRSLGSETMLTHSIPEEQVNKLLKLLEAHDEAQGPRQPEPLPESMGRDDGSEGSQGAATEHLHTA